MCANTHEWPDLGWRSGVNSEPGVGIAVDWVTGRSYSFAIEAGRRLNVESGLRRPRGHSKGVCGKRMGPVGEDSAAPQQGFQ